MKKTLLALIVLSLNTVLASNDVSLICKSSFNGEIYNLVEEQNATCLADFVWGYESVCYQGDAPTLVNLINNEFFNNRSGLIVTDAKLQKDGTISYLGIDQQSFYSSNRSLSECAE